MDVHMSDSRRRQCVIGLSLWGTVSFLWALVDFCDRLYYLMISRAVASLAIFVAVVMLTFVRFKPATFEYCVVAASILWGTVITWGNLLGDMSAYSNIWFNLAMAQVHLLFTGLSRAPSTFIMAVHVVNTLAAAWVFEQKFTKESILGLLDYCALPLLIGVGVYHQQSCWRALHDAQQDLKAEHQATESLLTMICDAGFWLAADGDTMIGDIDRRFDSLIGVPTTGKSFIERLEEEDVMRFMRITEGSSAPDNSGSPHVFKPVELLHNVKISRARAGPIVADLFIVDRRQQFADTHRQHMSNNIARSKTDAFQKGFLVGLRLSCDSQHSTATESGMLAAFHAVGRNVRTASSLMISCSQVDLEMGAVDGAAVGAENHNWQSDVHGCIALPTLLDTSQTPRVPLRRAMSKTKSSSELISDPGTLLSTRLEKLHVQLCSRAELGQQLFWAAARTTPESMRKHLERTIRAGINLCCDHAKGGALVCIAREAAFRRVFVKEGSEEGESRNDFTLEGYQFDDGEEAPPVGPLRSLPASWGSKRSPSTVTLDPPETPALSSEDSQEDMEPVARMNSQWSSATAQPALRTSDGGYMTNRLKGIHISDERFKEAFEEFTEHSASDRWPDDYVDEAARGQPKDGALILDVSGFRLKCAAKLLGLPPPRMWNGVGTKHEAALACAWVVDGCVVLVRSDAGCIHGIVRRGPTLNAFQLEESQQAATRRAGPGWSAAMQATASGQCSSFHCAL